MQPAVKIIPRIVGGLGNQLFIYAAARRLSIINNAELVIDDISGFVHDHGYQRFYQLDHFNIPCRKAIAAERFEPLSLFRRYFAKRWNQLLPFEQRRYLVQEIIDFDPRVLNLTPRKKLYLEGYWQSENYFKDVEPVIRKELSIKPPKDPINQKVAAEIRECVGIAVHVRFFDDPGEPGYDNLVHGYYERAIKYMEKHVPDAHYFIFSDQPVGARARIPLPDERITMVVNNQGDANAYADLWLMTQCQHFIIANSTFSWWGAWLANNKNKHVVAPGFEKRDGKMWWGFNGLLPDGWLKF